MMSLRYKATEGKRKGKRKAQEIWEEYLEEEAKIEGTVDKLKEQLSTVLEQLREKLYVTQSKLHTVNKEIQAIKPENMHVRCINGRYYAYATKQEGNTIKSI
jgi:hypothetical protein